MQAPSVTIVIRTLNRLKYVREALSCVLAQDYPNLDILVSDNGSTDGTAELVQELIKNDRRVRFRRNEATVSNYEHLVQCVAAVHGEFFILFCDDDRLNRTFVSEVIGVAMRHPDVNVVIPRNVTIDGHGATLQEFATPDGEVLEGVETACHWLYQRPGAIFRNVVTVLVRTEVLRHFGGYADFARGLSIDNMLFLQCALTGRVGFAHGAVFSWRVYKESMGSGATLKEIVQSARQFQRHLRTHQPTVRALHGLPKSQCDEILNGVSTLFAQEFLSTIRFHKHPFRPDVLLKLLTHPFDSMVLRYVLGHYYTRMRTLLLPDRGATIAQPPASTGSK